MMNETFVDHQIEVPTRAVEGMRCVFYAGDVIAPDVKSANPDWRRGGVLRPDHVTLGHVNGFIERCRITPLRQAMPSERAGNIAPAAREFKPKAYNVTEGGVTRTVGVRTDGTHDGLLRTPFYPVDQIRQLTGQVDGIVDMPCSNAAEIVRAQYFLFPDWDRFADETAELPQKAATLRKYLVGRLDEALRNAGSDPNDFFVRIARAAVKSCDDYAAWGQRRIRDANVQMRNAETKGAPYDYGSEVEMLFAQLGIQRADRMAQDTSSKMDALTDVMTKQAEAVTALLENSVGKAPQAATPAPARPVAAESGQNAEIVIRCNAITGSGNQCQNQAEANGFCKVPQHQAKAEEAVLAAEAELQDTGGDDVSA